jgi:hypothetical protein
MEAKAAFPSQLGVGSGQCQQKVGMTVSAVSQSFIKNGANKPSGRLSAVSVSMLLLSMMC